MAQREGLSQRGMAEIWTLYIWKVGMKLTPSNFQGMRSKLWYLFIRLCAISRELPLIKTSKCSAGYWLRSATQMLPMWNYLGYKFSSSVVWLEAHQSCMCCWSFKRQGGLFFSPAVYVLKPVLLVLLLLLSHLLLIVMIISEAPAQQLKFHLLYPPHPFLVISSFI